MIIQCDQCSARFRLDDNKVTESGVKVRCKHCQHIFLVQRELPQEEPDLDALLGLQLGTKGSQAIPTQEPPAPEPAPSAPEPDSTPPEGDTAPFFLPIEQTVAALPAEPVPASQDTDEFSFTVEPALAEAKPPTVILPPDDFSFSFDSEPPASTPTVTDLLEASFTSETAAPHDLPPVVPQPADEPGFSFEDEFPDDVATTVPYPPEPAAEAAATDTDWDEFEIDIPSPQPMAGEQEPVTGTSAIVADAAQPEETTERSSWDGLDSFEIELPEPGGPPAEPVPGKSISIAVPAPPTEPVEEEPFDYSGWSPEDAGTAAALSLSTPEPTEIGGEPLSSPLTESLAFSYSSAAAPIPPVTSESPSRSAPESTKEELPETPAPLPIPAVGVDDTFTFDDAGPLPSRRQGPSPIAIVGIVLAALMVLVVGGGSALYLLKGPEALKKVGLGSMVGFLGAEKAVQERLLLKNLEGSYVNNSETGELFIIRGEAVNSFRTPRAAIQVRGLIYNAAGTVILQKTTFCGNPLPQEQLATLPLAKIEEAMNNRLGDSYANIGVPPGKSVPFVIVFSGLPKDAADFGVEVAGSQAAGQ